MIRYTALLAVFLSCACLLVACGGGGGDADQGGDVVGRAGDGAPVANPGLDQDVAVGALVTLEGAASAVAASTQPTYSWSFSSLPVQSAAVLEEPKSSSPHFVPDVPGAFVLRLVVSAGDAASEPAFVTIVAHLPGEVPDGESPGRLADACQPFIDEARDALMFVWRDDDGLWHVRAFAGAGPAVRYVGRIRSSSGVRGAPVPEALAGSGGGVVEEGGAITFDLNVNPGSYSGFAFAPIDGNAELNFSLDEPGGAVLRVGPRRSPAASVFRMDRTGPCGAPQADGRPPVAPAGALALWREELGEGSLDRWRLRDGAGADHAGSIVSDQPFGTVAAEPAGSPEILQAVGGRIDFALPAAASGFSFDIAKGAHPCLALDTPADAAVLVGPGSFPLVPPFDLVTLGECPAASSGDDSTYNYLVFLTDDQRWDTLNHDVMPLLHQRLEEHGGVRFTNAYVTTPLCCPVRATIHSGGLYAHRTGYLLNIGPNGNVDVFRDDRTLARLLHDRGYSTMFVGKYFSTYAGVVYEHAFPYVPPGWTRFVGRSSWTTDPAGWGNFLYTTGSSRDVPSIGVTARSRRYTMDYEKDLVLDFIDQARDRPFYIFVAPSAPHPPAMPAEQDAGRFSGFVYDNPAIGADVSDKPSWVAAWPAKGETLTPDFIRAQLDSLQAVDRAAAEIIDRLEAHGILDRTILMFASDNGFLWGEHGLWGKGVPYEASVRVPLAIIAPQRTQFVEDDHLVAMNLDIGATVVDFARLDLTAGGVEPGSDGISLRPLIEGSDASWARENLFMEHFGPRADMYGLWNGVVQHRGRERWKFVQSGSGEEELYDLAVDPNELRNLLGEPDYAVKAGELRDLVQTNRPLAITTFAKAIQWGAVGEFYQQELSAWGGTPPYDYRWSLHPDYPLPRGLALQAHPRDPFKAIISGVPEQPVCRRPVWVTVEDVMPADAARETVRERGQRYTIDTYRFTIGTRNPAGGIVNPCNG